MRDALKVGARRWLVVGGLLLLMGIASVGYVQAGSLREDEVYWLTYIREEEKLARDVYLFLYDKWGSRIFSKIIESEETHMAAVETLLDRYGIPDPVEGKAPGEFTEESGLKAVYDNLIAQGEASLVEALKVGVIIEDTDIDDLDTAIALTGRRDINRVYSNLLQGSYNHLDAFCSDLERLGVTDEACQQ